MKERLGLIVGLIVAGVWATTAIAGIFTGDFQGLEVVSPVMLLLAGWLFGIEIVRRKVSTEEDKVREATDEAFDRWSHLP